MGVQGEGVWRLRPPFPLPQHPVACEFLQNRGGTGDSSLTFRSSMILARCIFCAACVEVCPTQARVFGDLNKQSSPIRRFLRFNAIKALKQELNTRPKVFYANADLEVR